MKARSWAGQIGQWQPAVAAASGSCLAWRRGSRSNLGSSFALSRSRLALCLSLSQRHGDTAASLSLSVSLAALASRSLTFLSFFLFLFLVFWHCDSVFVTLALYR